MPILTEKTQVDRKLFATTVIINGVFCVSVILFLSLVLHEDFRSSRLAEYDSPAIYCGLRDYSLFFLIGIPLTFICVGGMLSLYRSVTIGTLCLYHFMFSLVVLLFVLFVILVLIFAHGTQSYSIVSPLCRQCYP